MQIFSKSTKYLLSQVQYFFVDSMDRRVCKVYIDSWASRVLAHNWKVHASLGSSWPHTRQEQEAVPHSASTAHCCLSFPFGFKSQKHPTRRCNCLPHCLTYMYPHSITLIPKTANLHGGSPGGFQFQQHSNWPLLRDSLLQLLNLTTATLQVGLKNFSAWNKNSPDFKPTYVV